MVMENLLTCFVNHNSMAFDLLFVFSMVKIQPVFNSFLNEKNSRELKFFTSLNYNLQVITKKGFVSISVIFFKKKLQFSSKISFFNPVSWHFFLGFNLVILICCVMYQHINVT